MFLFERLGQLPRTVGGVIAAPLNERLLAVKEHELNVSKKLQLKNFLANSARHKRNSNKIQNCYATELALIKVLVQEFRHVDQNGARHGRVRGANEFFILKELAIVVARKHHTVLGVTVDLAAGRALEIASDRICCDHVGEALDAERSAIIERRHLNIPPELAHTRRNILFL